MNRFQFAFCNNFTPCNDQTTIVKKNSNLHVYTSEYLKRIQKFDAFCNAKVRRLNLHLLSLSTVYHLTKMLNDLWTQIEQVQIQNRHWTLSVMPNLFVERVDLLSISSAAQCLGFKEFHLDQTGPRDSFQHLFECWGCYQTGLIHTKVNCLQMNLSCTPKTTKTTHYPKILHICNSYTIYALYQI